jgi:hypothetical protein
MPRVPFWIGPNRGARITEPEMFRLPGEASQRFLVLPWQHFAPGSGPIGCRSIGTLPTLLRSCSLLPHPVVATISRNANPSPPVSASLFRRG